MKIGSGKVRIHPGPAKEGTSEEELMAQRPFCQDCEAPRTILHLEPFRRTVMRVCVNPYCWKFINIDKFETWKK